MQSIIQLKGIEKEFKVPKKINNPTFWQNVKGVFYRKWLTKKILHNINLDVQEGEFVGYVGSNGAGKSTTIKILTGVLTPSKGIVKVAGFVPYEDRYNYTYNIGVVFGHRSLLEFDIPVVDSFYLYKDIYELSDSAFKERLDYFCKILKIDELLHIPVRKLSLGQRMRCEIAASLLHRPKVVFLDEPTIGLDAIAKEEIRNFLRKINKEEKTTIILTTHDMDDIESLCKRIVLIDNGKIIYDGGLEELKKKYLKHKTVEFEMTEVTNKRKFDFVLRKCDIVKLGKKRVHLRVDITKYDIPEIINEILESCDVVDLLIHEPRLEHIVKEIYQAGKVKK